MSDQERNGRREKKKAEERENQERKEQTKLSNIFSNELAEIFDKMRHLIMWLLIILTIVNAFENMA